ncbi:recombinase family protein [Streptomyces argyrophyllae]|uniref:Recombinase family protein n=1 Tax=Streptomyces argyrophylli TaxID=2726118 RepID=A0A6M4PF07_9ACTN|nr:recombinase family protein [Streptomyces argyrophyllae]QJS09069.1 recombinase family protein [Streptomyces argyrophyllae]
MAETARPWAAYCRISDADLAELRYLVNAGALTPEEAKERERKGVLKQREDLSGLAANLGVSVVWYEDNNLSAFKRRVKRKDFERMLVDLATPGLRGGILAVDIDRLTRQNRDLERVIDIYETTKQKLGFVTLSGQNFDLSTPDGRFSARIMVSVANKASEDMSRRLKREMLRKAREGELTGGHRPFGWEDDRKTARPAEAEMVAKQTAAGIQGDSVATVTRRFKEAGFVGRTGKSYDRTAVRRILLNPRNAGIRVYQGEPLKDDEAEYVMGDWDALVSVQSWEALKEKWSTNQGAGQAREYRTSTLLSGILRCGACGTRMIAANSKSKYPKYRCAEGAGGCGNVSIIRNKTDEIFRQLVSEYLEKAAANLSLAKEPEETQWEKEPELVEAETELANIKAMYNAGKIKPTTYAVLLDDLDGKIEKLRGERALHQATRPTLAPSLDALKNGWDQLSMEKQREVVRSVLRSILVAPTTKRGAGVDLNRLTPIFREE